MPSVDPIAEGLDVVDHCPAREREFFATDSLIVDALLRKDGLGIDEEERLLVWPHGDRKGAWHLAQAVKFPDGRTGYRMSRAYRGAT